MNTLEAFVACADAAAALLADRRIARMWDEPSALAGYTLGELAGHLSRAVMTVSTYLGAGGPALDDTLDAPGYFVTVLADHDPVDSDFHRDVRRRAAAAASAGPETLAVATRDAIDGMRSTGVDPDEHIVVLQGLSMSVDEYLRTRIVELVVHVDDVDVSIAAQPTPVPLAAQRIAASVLAEVAVLRCGALPTIRSLARRERQQEPVRAL